MYLKAAGACLILLASISMGLAGSSSLTAREESLRTLLRMAVLLKGEISYGGACLPDACRNISRRLQPPFDLFLRTLAEELEERRGSSFRDLFREQMEKRLGSCGLTRQDQKALMELGANLGYLDQKTQLHHLELYEEEVKHTLEETMRESPKKKKVCRILGILGGLFLVIFFY